MSESKSSYEDNLKQLRLIPGEEYDDKMTVMTGILSPYHFNKNMKYIEEKINSLYEHGRGLESISSYTREVLPSEVKSRRVIVEEHVQQAEETRDLSKYLGYHTSPVSLNETNQVVLDRDGSVLEDTRIRNGSITIEGSTLESVPVENIEIKNEVPPYYESYSISPEEQMVRSFYVLDGPATKGIAEEHMIKFRRPYDVTHIFIENTMSDIVDIHLIDENNNEIKVSSDPALGIKKTRASGIKFLINSKKYRKATYEYDASRVSDDFWIKVSERELARELGTEFLFDLEKETGLTQYKRDYEKYQSDLSSWTSERDAVNRRNEQAKRSYESRMSSYEDDLKEYEEEMDKYLTIMPDKKPVGSYDYDKI